VAYKLKIGDWVVFSHESTLIYNENGDRIVVAKRRAGVGMICGAVRRHLGKKVTPSYNEDLGDVAPMSLARDGTAEFYLVRQGMINRAIQVAEEHLRKIPKQKMDIPWLFDIRNEDSKRLVRMVRFKYTI